MSNRIRRLVLFDEGPGIMEGEKEVDAVLRIQKHTRIPKAPPEFDQAEFDERIKQEMVEAIRRDIYGNIEEAIIAEIVKFKRNHAEHKAAPWYRDGVYDSVIQAFQRILNEVK